MTKAFLREKLFAKFSQEWGLNNNLRPPDFPQTSQAAERLRRHPAYRQAQAIVVMPEPAMLQVRINALLDGKNLIAATPGLKQGLVRLNTNNLPLPRRQALLTGSALAKSGKPIRWPGSKLNRVDLVVGTALASDSRGFLLGDGRGLLDLLMAMLNQMQALTSHTQLVVLQHENQFLDINIPENEWDVPANLVVSPNEIKNFTHQKRTFINASILADNLAKIPLIKAVMNN